MNTKDFVPISDQDEQPQELAAQTTQPSSVEDFKPSKKQRRQRIWEVDFLRGFFILLVVIDHTICDIMLMGFNGAYTSEFGKFMHEIAVWYWISGWRAVIQPFCVCMFIFLSGISCSLSRSNLLRGVKLAIIAGGVTVATYVFSSIMGASLTIVFNVLHVLTICIFVWAIIELIEKFLIKRKLPWGILFAFALLSVLVGEVFKLGNEGYTPMLNDVIYPHYLEAVNGAGTNSALTWLFYNSNVMSADFHPIFPALGYFLLGALFARGHYKQKVSLFPNAKTKGVNWLCFCGRHTLWFYLGGQVFAYAFIYLLAELIN